MIHLEYRLKKPIRPEKVRLNLAFLKPFFQSMLFPFTQTTISALWAAGLPRLSQKKGKIEK